MIEYLSDNLKASYRASHDDLYLLTNDNHYFRAKTILPDSLLQGIASCLLRVSPRGIAFPRARAFSLNARPRVPVQKPKPNLYDDEDNDDVLLI